MLTKKFWDIYTTEDITYRDQPLWNFLLLKYDFTPIIRNDLKRNTISRRWKHRCWFIANRDNRGLMQKNYKKGLKYNIYNYDIIDRWYRICRT